MKTGTKIKTLEDLYRSEEFAIHMEQTLGNDGWINDPERMERCHEAAENGCGGSFHAEVIQDWRDCLGNLDLDEETWEAIEEDIDTCEAWHEANGSLWNQIG
jgi:hypothetical protein